MNLRLGPTAEGERVSAIPIAVRARRLGHGIAMTLWPVRRVQAGIEPVGVPVRPMTRTGERIMADRNALAGLGMTFGAVTAAVMLMAAFTVKGHADGRLSLAPAAIVIAASLGPR